MAEWGIALIAACSALAASLITGWLTRSAALESVRMTLQDQRAVRVLDSRRQAYRSYLTAANAVIVTLRTGEGTGGADAVLQQTFDAVLLEGPAEVVRAAEELLASLRDRDGRSPDDRERVRQAFISAAQRALGR